MIDTDGWPFEGERPADWDRAGEISRVAMLLARQQALMQSCADSDMTRWTVARSPSAPS